MEQQHSSNDFYTWSHLYNPDPLYYPPTDNYDDLSSAHASLMIQDHKIYGMQPPIASLSALEHPISQPVQHGWGALQPFPSRYMSPAGSHPSSFSDVSSSSGSAACSEATSHPIRCSASPISFIKDYTFKSVHVTESTNMPWEPTHHSAVPQWHAETPNQVLKSQPALSILRYTSPASPISSPVNGDHNWDDDEAMSVHGQSPMNRPEPEELKLSEAPMTPISESEEHLRTSTQHAKKSVKEYLTDEESPQEEEEDMVVDNESDSDYQTQPKKRKNSRSSNARGNKSPNHRRKSSSHSVIGRARVAKRSNSTSNVQTSGHNRRQSKSKPRKGPIFKVTTGSDQPPVKGARIFPCTFHHFGCPSVFPNKNEWKRHVACQHLQLGFFRCDLDNCNPDTVSAPQTDNNRRQSSQIRAKRIKSEDKSVDSDEEIIKIYNDFNRKDLFTQHCRRMHGPSRNSALCSSTNRKGVCVPTKDDEAAFEKELENIRARCWQVRRKAPSRSNCGFCYQIFDASYFTAPASTTSSAGSGTSSPSFNTEEKVWEERMEHVGRHYEKGDSREDEEIDEDLVAWGLSCGVFYRLDDGRVWLVSAEAPTEEIERKESEEERRKIRRQPSRTFVVEKKEATVESSSVTDDDADGETE